MPTSVANGKIATGMRSARINTLRVHACWAAAGPRPPTNRTTNNVERASHRNNNNTESCYPLHCAVRRECKCGLPKNLKLHQLRLDPGIPCYRGVGY
eukprot:scaffold210847_cov17-Prasinocladus_malaysianus.AAC.1